MLISSPAPHSASAAGDATATRLPKPRLLCKQNSRYAATVFLAFLPSCRSKSVRRPGALPHRISTRRTTRRHPSGPGAKSSAPFPVPVPAHEEGTRWPRCRQTVYQNLFPQKFCAGPSAPSAFPRNYTWRRMHPAW